MDFIAVCFLHLFNYEINPLPIAQNVPGVRMWGHVARAPAIRSCKVQKPWSMAIIQRFNAHLGASAGRAVDLLFAFEMPLLLMF